MKRVFTTNWQIYQAGLHSSSKPKLQRDISEKASTLGSQRNRVFQKFLLEAVDEGLSSLGDSSKKAVYFYLEKAFKIKKQNIPNKIDEFTDAIERIFGHGAKVLEIQIMKKLYEKIGSDFAYFPETDELLFSKYIEVAKYACVSLETRSRILQP